jgi:hypothetical protein
MKKELQKWQHEDAERLRALFEEKATRMKISQQAFGLANDIGTQGMVWQYLRADRALNVEALLKFSKGLKIPPKSISPTLWKIIDEGIAYESSRFAEDHKLDARNSKQENVDQVIKLRVHPREEGSPRTKVHALVDQVPDYALGDAEKRIDGLLKLIAAAQADVNKKKR